MHKYTFMKFLLKKINLHNKSIKELPNYKGMLKLSVFRNNHTVFEVVSGEVTVVVGKTIYNN